MQVMFGSRLLLMQIRDEAVDYAEGCMARLSETFSEATPAASFLRGNVFDHPQLAGVRQPSVSTLHSRLACRCLTGAHVPPN